MPSKRNKSEGAKGASWEHVIPFFAFPPALRRMI
jgi:transposase-like protein